jgi:hypothetical protein
MIHVPQESDGERFAHKFLSEVLDMQHRRKCFR